MRVGYRSVHYFQLHFSLHILFVQYSFKVEKRKESFFLFGGTGGEKVILMYSPPSVFVLDGFQDLYTPSSIKCIDAEVSDIQMV
jgi:hypothetical protein